MNQPGDAAPGCPSEDVIARVVLDEAGGEDERRAVLAHIHTCDPCRRLVGTLADTEPASPTPSSTPRPLAARTLTDGEVLLGRYEIQSFIARGGMGEVYRAQDRLLRETVALKTVLCASSADDDVLARFRAEAQLARKVTHSNVCRILEFGLYERPRSGETLPFFTMPLLDGVTLTTYLHGRGNLPLDEARELLLQIVAGLEAIHHEGIVHRDLKSENVFLVGDKKGGFRVMLMDFGLARPLLTNSWRTFSHGNALVGTPAYIAPELLMGRAATVRSDLYSLGIIAFELLSGRVPFEGGTAVEAAASRLYREAPRLREIDPSIPEAWDTFVARCLARDEDERFQDAAAFRAALPGGTLGSRRRPFTRRHLVLTAASAAALAVVAASWFGRGSASTPGPNPIVTANAEMAAPRPAPGAPPPAGPPPAASPPALELAEAPAAASRPRALRARPARPKTPTSRALPAPPPVDPDAVVNPYD